VIGNLLRQSLRDLWRFSPVLAAMREGGGCMALNSQSRPSNPYLRLGEESVPVFTLQ
jgi:hypothetical protein